MKIVGLKTCVVGNPPPGFGGRYFMFLKLITDNGIEGVGEVYAATFGPKVVGDDRGRVRAARVDPILRIEAIWRRSTAGAIRQRPDISLMGVLSGVEMALWDIVGKAVDKPVYALLGGKVHERLRTYTYIYPRAATDRRPASTPTPILGAARGRICAEGFTAVKFDPAGRFRLRSAPARA